MEIIQNISGTRLSNTAKRPSGHGPAIKPTFSTVTAAFYHYATTYPTALAARDLSVQPPRDMTYGELAQQASRLSHRLRDLGVLPGDRVPLVVKRGTHMLVGIIGILTCGAQYVPVDGGVVSDSTLQFILQQAGGRTSLTVKSTRHRLESSGVANIVVIDDIVNDDGDTYSRHTVSQDLATPNSGCYVIYTSGTTGTPKGVDVTHHNVTNLLCLRPGNLRISPGVYVGQVLNISFDMAAWETLGCLCNGGTLVLRGSDWCKTLEQIDVLICTPSILAKLDPQDYPNIHTVATAGEPSSQRLADRWAAHATYHNCCGPTETTIVNTMHTHQPGQPLTIGKPTPNNIVYILNEDKVPVNVGEAGFMWAGGAGVTRGYIGMPEKTAEKYHLDHFQNDGSFMYNTGDICRWDTSGSIEILGRVDDQVKVKGFRVELDGVAASLSACAAVDMAAVLLIEGEIHGFISPLDCDLQVVRQQMSIQQPYYAVPSSFHRFSCLPLTSNGKIDKYALKQAAVSSSDDTSTICESASEKSSSPKITTVEKISAHSRTSSATTVVSTSNPTTSVIAVKEELDLEAAMPDKHLQQPVRGLRHRIMIVYRRLFTIVSILNIAAAIGLVIPGIKREWLGNMTAINLVLAVLVRQDAVINILYTITCSVPKSWPLCIRTRCAKIYHLGGVHSGAAVWAALWLLASNISDAVCMATGSCSNWGNQTLAAKIVSWMLSAGFVAMIVLAWPSIRKRHHDMFERTHRFLGWTMLGLFWVQVVLTINDGKTDEESLGFACVKSPPFWLLAVASLCIASSWFFLRKVPVEAEVLSDHAVRLHFGYTIPVNGSFTRISRRPLIEWHSFAAIPAPVPVDGRPKGYSLVVSNAGDWTKSCIQNPPKHLWVRSLPTCGVMRIATLFNRIVVIATGSGIGPLLGHIQNPSCDTQLIWSTAHPEKTFGKEMVQTIKEKIPGAVIHNTKVLGRPDLVKMGFNLVRSFNAEAVVIIANEKITKKVVYGLETRGVPAYGAIWDS